MMMLKVTRHIHDHHADGCGMFCAGCTSMGKNLTNQCLGRCLLAIGEKQYSYLEIELLTEVEQATGLV
jgi:hypothetical protein